MSNEKEQYERFESLLQHINFPCEKCPANEVCHSESTTTEDIQYTCEETLWHYIQTGRILI